MIRNIAYFQADWLKFAFAGWCGVMFDRFILVRDESSGSYILAGVMIGITLCLKLANDRNEAA